VLKLDGATGEVLWSQHYAGAEGLDEAALAVACDAQDNVYFAGRATVSGQGVQMLAMRLDANDGQIVWSRFLGLAAGQDDVAWDIVVGPDGRPVIGGVGVDAGGAAVGVVVKLDAADGGTVWQHTTAGLLNDFSSAGTWLALQDDGDVVACQRGYGTNGHDVLLSRHAAADGVPAWSVRYDGPTHGGDKARHMVRDAAGDLLVTGVQDAWWNYDFMLLKFDGASGALVWEAPGYDGPPGWYDEGCRVGLAPDGSPVVVGLSDGSGTGWDMATVGYDPDTGAIAWALRHDGEASQSDEPRDVAVSPLGDMYVTGYGYGSGTGKDHITLRYLQVGGSGVPAAPAGAALGDPWPNPFNPSCAVSFTLDRAETARLAIYAVDGSLVRVLSEGALAAGPHQMHWNGLDHHGLAMPAGVYLWVLRTGSGTAVRKSVLVR
jgi:outer membrane protein assembly factor BamB